MIQEAVYNLFYDQLANWETASDNYKALENVREKTCKVGRNTYRVQFNPARITSTAAKVDSPSIQERKCFLCDENRPLQQQSISFKDQYRILINPFPIFPKHLTIPDINHTPQNIDGRMDDMLDLAKELNDFVIFYNGPKSGASAPDHFHFQAGNKGFLSIEKECKNNLADKIGDCENAGLWYLDDTSRATLVIVSEEKKPAIRLFDIVYQSLDRQENDPEPMMNILAWYENGKYIICIFPRRKHRPDCYFAGGEENLLISPACVDLGGVFITPLEKDYIKINDNDINDILMQVSLGNDEFQALIQKVKQQL